MHVEHSKHKECLKADEDDSFLENIYSNNTNLAWLDLVRLPQCSAPWTSWLSNSVKMNGLQLPGWNSSSSKTIFGYENGHLKLLWVSVINCMIFYDITIRPLNLAHSIETAIFVVDVQFLGLKIVMRKGKMDAWSQLRFSVSMLGWKGWIWCNIRVRIGLPGELRYSSSF